VLEKGGVAFGGGLIQPRSVDSVIASGDLGYDFLILETEHLGFDADAVAGSLQFLLKPGEPRPVSTPLVRVPPYGRELHRNEWLVKQALDQGAMGVVYPHIETVAQARAAVAAARYPQTSRSEYFEPVGRRGWWPMNAARYWGLSIPDYYERADVWPINPDGEILVMLIIETPTGVENLSEILRDVEGVGAVWPGAGDFSISSGAGPHSTDRRIAEMYESVLDCCKANDVACVGVAMSPEEMDRRIADGCRITFSMASLADAALARGRKLRSEAVVADHS
jgi:4-hydroxy-2-oxoheptanedioate aldolase